MRPVETVDTTFAPLSPNLQRLILSQMRFFVESSRTRTNIENEYFRIFLIKKDFEKLFRNLWRIMKRYIFLFDSNRKKKRKIFEL